MDNSIEKHPKKGDITGFFADTFKSDGELSAYLDVALHQFLDTQMEIIVAVTRNASNYQFNRERRALH